MNDEVLRIYGYTFISKAKSKFFRQKFTMSRDARADTKSLDRVLCLRHAAVFFLSSKNAFRSYLMIFKCALAIRLRSLTVEISYVSSTGEVVRRKYCRNRFTFFGMHRREKLGK